MKLTPIQVRGKRKAKHLQSPGNTPQAIDQSEAPKPKRSLASVMVSKKRRGMREASIEGIPVEILEDIFLLSQNVALPLASQTLGARLSSRATLFKFFYLGFHDTWMQNFGTLITPPFLPPSELVGVEGNPELQSAILELPWCKLDFILEAQDVWAKRHARDRVFTHWSPQDTTSGTGIEAHHPLQHPVGGNDHFSIKQCFEQDYASAIKELQQGPNTVHQHMRDIHPATRVPLSLITGPWTAEQERLLFWLLRGGCMTYPYGRADDRYNVPWEACYQGLQRIIQADEPNKLVACLLMGHDTTQEQNPVPRLFNVLPMDSAREAADEISVRLQWGADNEDTRELLEWVKWHLNLRYDMARNSR